MNNNNNNITLMSDIDPSLYTNLKTKQQMFIRCIAESIGSMTTVEFSRKDLKEIAKRGIYSVPELASYRNAIHEDALESDHVTIVEDVPAADDMLDVVAECCDDAVDVLKDTTLGRAMTA